jgi:hypothetical protein
VEYRFRDAAFLKTDCLSEELSGCGQSPGVVGSTVSPPRIFFTLWTGRYAQNVTHVLFEADAARHSVRRVLETEAAMGNVMFSASGRYIAYSVWWTAGVCHLTSSVFAADLGVPGKAEGPATVAQVYARGTGKLGERGEAGVS